MEEWDLARLSLHLAEAGTIITVQDRGPGWVGRCLGETLPPGRVRTLWEVVREDFYVRHPEQAIVSGGLDVELMMVALRIAPLGRLDPTRRLATWFLGLARRYAQEGIREDELPESLNATWKAYREILRPVMVDPYHVWQALPMIADQDKTHLLGWESLSDGILGILMGKGIVPVVLTEPGAGDYLELADPLGEVARVFHQAIRGDQVRIVVPDLARYRSLFIHLSEDLDIRVAGVTAPMASTQAYAFLRGMETTDDLPKKGPVMQVRDALLNRFKDGGNPPVALVPGALQAPVALAWLTVIDTLEVIVNARLLSGIVEVTGARLLQDLNEALSIARIPSTDLGDGPILLEDLESATPVPWTGTSLLGWTQGSADPQVGAELEVVPLEDAVRQHQRLTARWENLAGVVTFPSIVDGEPHHGALLDRVAALAAAPLVSSSQRHPEWAAGMLNDPVPTDLRTTLQRTIDRSRLRGGTAHLAYGRRLVPCLPVSSSRLSTFNECPVRYHWTKQLRARWDIEDRTALDKGNVVHELLEKVIPLLNTVPVPDRLDLLRARLAAMDLGKGTPAIIIRAYVEDLIEHPAGGLRRFVDEHTKNKPTDELTEVRFGGPGWKVPLNTPAGVIHLEGKIDYHETHKGTIWVWDHKTGKLPTKKDLESVKVPQLAIYAAALAARYPEAEVGAGYIWLKEPEKLENVHLRVLFPPGEVDSGGILETGQAVDRLKERLGTMEAAVNVGTFEFVPDIKVCEYCDAKPLCRREDHDA